MSNHTPGPWKIADESTMTGGELWITVEHPEVGAVSLAAVRNGCGEADELGSRDANAALIAAAPDLLAALKAAWGHLDIGDGVLTIVEAAIAKAEGRAP